MEKAQAFATDEPEQASLTLWAHCPKCQHNWPACYYPLAMGLLAKIMKGHSRCPKCGTPGLVAKQHDGILDEPLPDSPLRNPR